MSDAPRFEPGQLWTFGSDLLRVVEGPVAKPFTVLRKDYDEHSGPDEPPPTAYRTVYRQALRVEYIPPRSGQAPEGGRWLDESCFASLKRFKGAPASPAGRSGSDA